MLSQMTKSNMSFLLNAHFSGLADFSFPSASEALLVILSPLRQVHFGSCSMHVYFSEAQRKQEYSYELELLIDHCVCSSNSRLQAFKGATIQTSSPWKQNVMEQIHFSGPQKSLNECQLYLILKGSVLKRRHFQDRLGFIYLKEMMPALVDIRSIPQRLLVLQPLLSCCEFLKCLNHESTNFNRQIHPLVILSLDGYHSLDGGGSRK